MNTPNPPRTLANCNDREWEITMRWIIAIGTGRERIPRLTGGVAPEDSPYTERDGKMFLHQSGRQIKVPVPMASRI